MRNFLILIIISLMSNSSFAKFQIGGALEFGKRSTPNANLPLADVTSGGRLAFERVPEGNSFYIGGSLGSVSGRGASSHLDLRYYFVTPLGSNVIMGPEVGFDHEPYCSSDLGALSDCRTFLERRAGGDLAIIGPKARFNVGMGLYFKSGGANLENVGGTKIKASITFSTSKVLRPFIFFENKNVFINVDSSKSDDSAHIQSVGIGAGYEF